MPVELSTGLSTELWMLLLTTLLFFVIIMIQALLGIGQNGLQAQAGSRDNLPAPNVLRERLQRLTANLQENLIIFAIVVIAAEVSGATNDTTALGASVFFYSRIAHALVYGFGLPWIRPVFWFTAICGVVAIASQLV